jgi:hypothetical protein
VAWWITDSPTESVKVEETARANKVYTKLKADGSSKSTVAVQDAQKLLRWGNNNKMNNVSRRAQVNGEKLDRTRQVTAADVVCFGLT